MTRAEIKAWGWDSLDVILVSGDACIDSPYIGTSVIGRWLVKHGFRVGIIAQPDATSSEDITRLGEPNLFWGVTGGSVDSMVANYTALNKKRRSDDYTPGGQNTRRPDRALIKYANLIRQHFKQTKPIVLGGIEASLRRVTHYDYWDDKLRKSVLFDAKADYLVYGMAERAVLELAQALKSGADPREVRGVCYIAKAPEYAYLQLPDHEACVQEKQAFAKAFETFYHNNDPVSAQGLCQKQDARYLVQNPPAHYLDEAEMDAIFALPYARDAHPIHKKQGAIRALETIRFSVTTHYGCYGECSFCAIAVHQGRTIRSRSEGSILEEVHDISRLPEFKGNIHDVGGPTANMYGFECGKKQEKGSCAKKPCTGRFVCKSLKLSHKRQIQLLQKIRSLPKIKRVFVASGIRYDLIEQDKHYGEAYLEEIIRHHLSGQMKIAPEHVSEKVLGFMNKPGKESLLRFREKFQKITQKYSKKQFLTYYFIAAHPGCSEQEMLELKRFASRELRLSPEQVQVFTPTPSTYASLMYYTGVDPKTGKTIFVEKNLRKKQRQKELVKG